MSARAAVLMLAEALSKMVVLAGSPYLTDVLPSVGIYVPLTTAAPKLAAPDRHLALKVSNRAKKNLAQTTHFLLARSSVITGGATLEGFLCHISTGEAADFAEAKGDV